MEQLEPAEVEAIAAYLHAEQVRQIEAAARQVGARVRGARRSCRSASGRSSPARWRSASAAPCSSCRGARRNATRRPRPRSPSSRPRARARVVLTVVKVGGGLAREAGDDALRALCAAIAEAGARHPLLVVPGGGEFADAVRAHDRRFGLRRADRAPDGDPGDGPVRLGARRPHPGRGALRGARAAARRCRLGPAAGRAAGGARPAPRVLGRHLGLDRRVGGRRRRRRAPRAAEAGRGPLPQLAAGRGADRAAHGRRARRAAAARASTSICPPRCGRPASRPG